MEGLHFLDVPIVSSLEDPDHGWKYLGMEVVEQTCWEESFGNADVARTAHEMVVTRSNEEEMGYHWIVAVEGDESQVIGMAEVAFFKKNNLDKVEASICVLPSHRRRGVGSALNQWCEQTARDLGRSLVSMWTQYGPHEDRGPRIEVGDGSSVPAETPGVSFLVKHGYEIAQVERNSMMDIPMDPAQEATIMSRILPFTDGYRLHTWESLIPDEWVDEYARLLEAFSLDAPMGGIDWEKETWDRDRVLRKMSDLRSKGTVCLITVAEQVATSQLVGCTELRWRPTRDSAEQWITEVVEEHRGHRLGMWMKLTNLDSMMAKGPGIRRLYTDNAEENGPMLDINVAMGFKPHGSYVLLKKTLD